MYANKTLDIVIEELSVFLVSGLYSIQVFGRGPSSENSLYLGTWVHFWVTCIHTDFISCFCICIGLLLIRKYMSEENPLLWTV